MTTSTTTLPPARLGSRNLGLDIARAIAITTVVLVHYLLEGLESRPVLTHSLSVIGAASVELFFSLSGFLIGWLLIDLADRALSARTVFLFWSRRWFRTLPLYFIVLAWASWSAGVSEPHAWLFLQNFYPQEGKLVPVSWSLVMEEYFYFFFPAIMLILSFFIRDSIRLVGTTAVLLIVCCTASRFANAYGVFNLGWQEVHEHPFMRMDCSAYGVLAVCLYRRYPVGFSQFVHRWGWLILACVGVLIALSSAVFVLVLAFWDVALRVGFATWGRPWFVLQHSFWDLVFAAMVLTLFVLRSGAGHGVVSAVIHRCSLWSYSIYLMHMVVVIWVDHRLHLVPGPTKVAVQIVGVAVVSIITFYAIERPFLALRERLSGKHRPKVAEADRRVVAQARV